MGAFKTQLSGELFGCNGRRSYLKRNVPGDRVPSRIHAGQMIAKKKCSVPLVVRPENVLCSTCFWNTKADKMA